MTNNDKELFEILQQLENETMSISNPKLIAPIKISHLIDEKRAEVISDNFSAARNSGFFSERSQAELASLMGVERTVIGNIERGQTKSAFNHILKAAIAMNVSVVWIAFGDRGRFEKYRGHNEKTAWLFRDLFFGIQGLVRNQKRNLSANEYNQINNSLQKSVDLVLEMGLLEKEFASSVEIGKDHKLKLDDK